MSLALGSCKARASRGHSRPLNRVLGSSDHCRIEPNMATTASPPNLCCDGTTNESRQR